MRNTLLLGTVILLAAASCKKEDEQETVTCRITTADAIEDNDSSRMTVTYDASGRPTSVAQDDETATFTYSGNTVRVERNAMWGSSYDSVILNSNNQIQTQYSYYGMGSGSYRTDYTYNGTELQRSVSQSVVGTGTPDTVTYEWSGGNLIREVYSPQYTSTYSYDASKPVVDNSDLLRFFSLTSTGGYTVLSRNLVTGINDGSNNISITYELDPNGRILVARVFGGGVNSRYRFGYTCQ